MISAGFANPVHASQAVFRAVMAATARPGTIQRFDEIPAAPIPFAAGAAAIALALLDQDSPVWLDPLLRQSADVREWIGFHTGAPIVGNTRQAGFAFVSDPQNLPAFDQFNCGTPEYPDRSTTIVLQVGAFGRGPSLRLTGPGIKGRQDVSAALLPADMPERLAMNRALFPRGVDLLLVTDREVAALPRSARVEEDQ